MKTPLSLALVLALASPVLSLETGVVVAVGDGDTVRVKDESGTIITVRIACIDAPEMAQTPHGEQSRNRLQQIIPIGINVTYTPQTTDRYGRTVAEIYREKLNVGLALIQEGRAVVYRDYLSQCDGTRYLAVEQTARDRRLAFWAQPNPVMPWDFRKGIAQSPKPSPASEVRDTQSSCDPSYPTICLPSSPDLDCGDISHRRFQVVGADPHRFDSDHDGVGCES